MKVAHIDLINIDDNATTLMPPAVPKQCRPYLTGVYGKPANAHQDLEAIRSQERKVVLSKADR